ncbi:hypothetical protein YPPY02_3244, partial [Yersinia pestis PY-02]
MPYIGWLWVV